MKKIIFLMSVAFLFSCGKSQIKQDFSSSIIYSQAYNEEANLTKAIVDAQKEAVKIAYETFVDKKDENSLNFFLDNYGFYIKKYKILSQKKEGNKLTVSLKVYFLLDKFVSSLKREKILSENPVKVALYPKFNLDFKNPIEKFKVAFSNTNYPEFYFLENEIDKENKSENFNYIVDCDIYSYSLSPSPELASTAIPVVSTGSFKISDKNNNYIYSFNIEENSIGTNFEEAVSSTLLSMGMKTKEKIVNFISEKDKQKRKVNLIFSNVKDINTLLKIKKAVASLPVSNFYLKSFFDKEALFIIELEKKNSNEELSSFLIRSDIVPMQVEYIEKEEIKIDLI